MYEVIGELEDGETQDAMFVATRRVSALTHLIINGKYPTIGSFLDFFVFVFLLLLVV